MTSFELAKEFLGNTSKMQKYNEAIALLREAGFENVLRRLGEPNEIPLDHPNHLSVSAFEGAEKRGWFQALSFLFDFQELIEREDKRDAFGDFGAEDKMKELGYGLGED